MSGGRVHAVLSQIVPLRPDEVAPSLYAASSLGCALASYFIVLPLREDAAIGLGTAALPRLFVLSLVTALLVAPMVSWLLNRPTARGRDRALRQLYQALAALQLVFYLFYTHPDIGAAAGSHGSAVVGLQPPGTIPPTAAAAAAAVAAAAAAALPQGVGLKVTPVERTGGDSSSSSSSSSSSPGGIAVSLRDVGGDEDTGDATDEMWGREDYGPDTQRRARQLLQTEAAAARPVSQPLTRALLAAADPSTEGSGGKAGKKPQRPPPPPLSPGQRLLRGSFYVWVSTFNLLSASSVWARCADAFADSGTRLFGIISCGATLGQLGGSIAALALASAARRAAAAGGGADGGPIASATLILLSAGLLFVASGLAPRIKAPDGGGPGPGGRGAAGQGPRGPAMRKPVSGGGSDESSGDGGGSSAGGGGGPSQSRTGGPAAGDSAGAGSRRSVASDVLAGFRLVVASEYLLLVCAYLLVTYVVGSLLYFEKALVVSQSLTGPGDRTAFFAWLNSWSATIIALCQLFATAGLLRTLGVPAAIALFPVICLVGLAVIALRPRPSSIAGVEIVRKVVGYAVIRPAREVLFTVVSRQEKYSAKLVIDLVVQRAGDAIAAGAFQLLDVHLKLGVGGVAAAGCVTCGAWLLAALRLGALHARLQHDRAKRDGSMRQKQEV